jgi:hypothetical protein
MIGLFGSSFGEITPPELLSHRRRRIDPRQTKPTLCTPSRMALIDGRRYE